MEIKGQITRTFYRVHATGFKISGINADGMPVMDVVDSEEYVTVNPNDLTQAKRACKLADKKVLPDTVRVNVLREEVRAMSLEQFYRDSDMVERQANGRVK